MNSTHKGGGPDELDTYCSRAPSQAVPALECFVALNLMEVFKTGIPTKAMSTLGSRNKARTCLPDLNAKHQRYFLLMQVSIKQGFSDFIWDDSITS